VKWSLNFPNVIEILNYLTIFLNILKCQILLKSVQNFSGSFMRKDRRMHWATLVGSPQDFKLAYYILHNAICKFCLIVFYTYVHPVYIIDLFKLVLHYT
jgi:hypothetical protein